MKRKLFEDAVRLCVLCIAWYTLSAAENIISKIILTDFPFPLTSSMAHSFFIFLLLGPILKIWRIPSPPNLTRRYYFRVIVPLAVGKVLASFTSQFSISKVPLSYAHTVKASMPIFTVLLSRIILHEKVSWKIYLSLLPIVGGIAIATVSEISFNFMGLFSALLSTFSFSLQNIYSKKAMKDKGIHHLRLLLELCKLGSLILLPVWFLSDVTRWPTHGEVKSPGLLFFLLLVDCFCNFAHSMVAFTIISLVSPLSYSVANATKRIVVITMSLLTLKNPVTQVNVLGMSIAVLGVLLYNKMKLDQARERKEILPTASTTTLYELANEGMNRVQLTYGREPSSTVLELHKKTHNSNATTQFQHSPHVQRTRTQLNGFVPDPDKTPSVSHYRYI